jgi:hypothetical protein
VKNKIWFLWVIGVASLSWACALSQPAQPTTEVITPIVEITAPPEFEITEVSSQSKLTLASIQSALIHSLQWGDFQLTDGVYYRPLPNPNETPANYSTRIQEPIIFGDLNADGSEDAVIVLNTHNGGNTPTFEIAVLLNQNGVAINISTIPLDGLTAYDTGRIENGILLLDTRTLGQNDPLCCPSQIGTLKFRLEGAMLISVP